MRQKLWKEKDPTIGGVLTKARDPGYATAACTFSGQRIGSGVDQRKLMKTKKAVEEVSSGAGHVDNNEDPPRRTGWRRTPMRCRWSTSAL